MPTVGGKTPSIVLRKGLARGDADGDHPLVSFLTKGVPVAARQRPERLPVNPLLPTRIPLEKSLQVKIVLGTASAGDTSEMKPTKWLWTMNGLGSDGVSGKPLFKIKRGGAVTIAFANTTSVVQQMHVHGHVFRILHDLDDGWDPYWRESILIAPGKTKHVAFIADNPGKWAIESLMLERQVTGLAGWFEVG